MCVYVYIYIYTHNMLLCSARFLWKFCGDLKRLPFAPANDQ